MFTVQKERSKQEGKKEYILEVNKAEYLPVKDIDIFLTDAKQSAVGVQLGRVCFGDSY